MPADLCIVTTCRGRLEHLQRALPTFVQQPRTQCVVVDYDCPQQTAQWVAGAFPEVTVVREHNRPHFQVTRARNLGAAAANAPWLCFFDADNLLAPNFAQVVHPLLRPGHYYRPAPRRIDATGMCICPAEDFRRIGGYDPVLQGYGMDDGDLYQRLERAGLQCATFPGELVSVIAHDAQLRVAHYAVKHVRLNNTANQVYCNMKWDLERLSGVVMPEADRVGLYDYVRRAVLAAHRDAKPLTLRVPVSVQKTFMVGGSFKTTLVYRVFPPGAGEPAVGAEPGSDPQRQD